MSTTSQARETDLQITRPISPAQAEILSPDARRFVAQLALEFEGRRQELLARRKVRQAEIDAGHFPIFFPRPRRSARRMDGGADSARSADRRVEITGPVDRKMVINALNSGANVFMADFEDPNSPTWDNIWRARSTCATRSAGPSTIQSRRQGVQGGRESRDPVRAPARLASARAACAWSMASRCRARCSISGCTFSITRRTLLATGTGPYFYLPKMESHLEARLWNDVFIFAQEHSAIPQRDHPRHGADRDHSRCLRDGRDPL